MHVTKSWKTQEKFMRNRTTYTCYAKDIRWKGNNDSAKSLRVNHGTEQRSPIVEMLRTITSWKTPKVIEWSTWNKKHHECFLSLLLQIPASNTRGFHSQVKRRRIYRSVSNYSAFPLVPLQSNTLLRKIGLKEINVQKFRNFVITKFVKSGIDYFAILRFFENKGIIYIVKIIKIS